MTYLRRCRTVPVGKEEVDFVVLGYSCVDSSVLSTLGKHCKETSWKIALGSDSAAIEVKLHVDKQVMSNPKVRIEWAGAQIFPAGNATKEKLREDFSWCVPFRGIVRGLAVKNAFEVRPEHGPGDWLPATLLDQRPDGLFTAMVDLPDGKGGVKEVHFDNVKIENVREAGGAKKALVVPRRNLVLNVPQEDPLHAMLSMDDGTLLTHFFARPTPPPAKDGARTNLVKPKVLLKVSKDRERVTSDVGHEVLSRFLRGDVWAAGEQSTRRKKAWLLQVGPFAEHVVEVEKKYKSSGVVTLSVDGDVLCEALAEDIESQPGLWECPFRLEGDRYLEWEVHETDVDGCTLDTVGVVSKKMRCCHEVVVSIPDPEKSLGGAELTIDSVEFGLLPQTRRVLAADKLDCGPEALKCTYDLTPPYKVNDNAPRSFFRRVQECMSVLTPQGASGGGADFLARCCSASPQVAKDDFIAKPRQDSNGR